YDHPVLHSFPTRRSSDLGVANSGVDDSPTQTFLITVNAVNDAPVNVVPVAQATNEDTSKTFSSGGGNALSVSDVDVAETVGGKRSEEHTSELQSLAYLVC